MRILSQSIIKTQVSIFLSCVLFFLSYDSSADHFVGGDMTYECLEQTTDSISINITLNIYKDLNISPDLNFLPETHITIFLGNDLPYQQIAVLPVRLDTIKATQSIDYPCIILPKRNVEQGTYQAKITLAIANESYLFVHQACCRSELISNIDNPRYTESTYLIELNPKAQQLCNQPPVYQDLPFLDVCAGEDIIIEQDITELDGDSLVFELCSPLAGKNNDSPSFCLSSITDACPPPYHDVLYISGYNAQQPLGQNSIFQLDSSTGLLSIYPTIQGSFAVGICIKEYRDDVLLSITRRDFQINVNFCTPLLSASILSDEIGPNGEFIINKCNANSINLENTSTSLAPPIMYQWNFDGIDSLNSFFDWNPTFVFQDAGSYHGEMIISTENGLCTDTAFILIHNSHIIADYTFSPLKLSNLNPTIHLSDNSIGADSYEWTVYESTFFNKNILNYTFPDTGYYDISLVASNLFGCSDSLTKTIYVQPENTYFLPNAFTPNYDGKNDVFSGKGILVGMKDFSFKVWNRWGENVFSSTSPTFEWNGKKHNHGHPLPIGIYVYTLYFIKANQEIYQSTGQIMLSR